jgi:hypothetical protein
MKATIFLDISGVQALNRLAPAARNLVQSAVFENKTIDLLAFPFSSSNVVTSSAIKKALAKLEGRDNLVVAVGWDFTLEARALLKERGAVAFGRDFGWTDARWFAIKQKK